MGVARRVVLNPEQKEVLEQCARARSRSGRQVEGARIVWLAAAGKLDQERAAALNVTAHKAARWRNRFLDLGMAGLEKDAPRAGRTPRIPAATVQQVVDKTTLEKPANATHWSTRTRAAAVNLSAATVRRIWHEQGHKPHLMETFQVSSDPRFAETLEAIVGLYLHPPEHARVLCCDEKSQIQALDRTHPGLATETWPGRNHDPRRQAQRHRYTFRSAEHSGRQGDQLMSGAPPTSGMASLPAAGRGCHAREPTTASDRGQLRHPPTSRRTTRVETPPSVSLSLHPHQCLWLNRVERFFRDLTVNRLRRGVFRHGMELVRAIDA